MSITGSLRMDHTSGEHYTFSVRAFHSWKKNFLEAYEKEYGQPFRLAVPDPLEREAAYKSAFSMSSVDIFQTGNGVLPLSESIFLRVQHIQNILSERK